MEIDNMSGTGNVRFRVHRKRQQAQSINISNNTTCWYLMSRFYIGYTDIDLFDVVKSYYNMTEQGISGLVNNTVTSLFIIYHYCHDVK